MTDMMPHDSGLSDRANTGPIGDGRTQFRQLTDEIRSKFVQAGTRKLIASQKLHAR